MEKEDVSIIVGSRHDVINIKHYMYGTEEWKMRQKQIKMRTKELNKQYANHEFRNTIVAKFIMKEFIL